MALKTQDRDKLNSIIGKMKDSNEDDSDIREMVRQFKAKYDKPDSELAATPTEPTEDAGVMGMFKGAGREIGAFAKGAAQHPLETSKGLLKGVGNASIDIFGRPIAKGLAKAIPGEDVFGKAVGTERARIAAGGPTTEFTPSGKIQERASKVGEFATKAGIGGGLAAASIPAMAAAGVTGAGATLAAGALSNLPFVPDAFEEGGAKGALKDMALNTAIDLATLGIGKAIPAVKARLVAKGLPTGQAGALAADAVNSIRGLNTKAIDAVIERGINKGVKPTVAGKGTLKSFQAFQDKAKDAVKIISINKDKINVLNEVGEVVSHPKTAAQMAQALDQTKQAIYKQYHNLALEAGDSGSKFKMGNITSELSRVSSPSNVGLSPKAREYAESLSKELAELEGAAPEIIEKRIADLNQSLAGFYDNRVNKATAQVDASVAKLMRDQLDAQITSTVNPGYKELKKQYGALLSVEKEINKRALVNARKSNKSIIDMTDIFTNGDLAAGILTMNPMLIVKGATGRGIKEIYKVFNNPERYISDMFKKTYNIVDNAKLPGRSQAKALMSKTDMLSKEDMIKLAKSRGK